MLSKEEPWPQLESPERLAVEKQSRAMRSYSKMVQVENVKDSTL